MKQEVYGVLPVWRSRVEEWRGSSHQAEHHQAQQARSSSRAALLDWIERLRGGAAPLEELRQEFDRRSRSEWRFWGLRGPQGAMFLNMLAKNLDQHARIQQVLGAALAVPASPQQAEQQIRDVVAYLDARIAAGDASRRQVHPTRAATLLSGLWNAQETSWPMYWRSARQVFRADGLITEQSDVATRYGEYCGVYQALMEALDLSAWEVESICYRADALANAVSELPPAGQDDAAPKRRVWLVSPGRGAHRWEEWLSSGHMAIRADGLGDLRDHASPEALDEAIRAFRDDGVNPYNDVKCGWQFTREIQEGDLVYAKRGRRQLIGVGVVRGDYRYVPRDHGFSHVRAVDWTPVEGATVSRDLITKTLTEVTAYPNLRRALEEAVEDTVPDVDGIGEGEDDGVEEAPAYGREDALRDLFLDEDTLDTLLALLHRKRNLVLQGPPGTGKTYVASRLARLVVGSESSTQVARVQFHQSMTYEDFVQGFRPAESGGFQRVDGPFLRFCNLALQDQDTPYVLLIDEINRGNLSRILGELMILIEPDKRSPEWGVTLSYAQDDEAPFWVPPNLHIIGTMNTADRSLALVDYALRRRFAFFDLPSAVHTPRFADFLRARGVPGSLVEELQARVAALNREIRSDPDLGAGFELGHSYFCDPPAGEDAEAWVDQVVRTELDPLLREYWFDAPERVEAAVDRLVEGL